jgi:competence protein ComEA
MLFRHTTRRSFRAMPLRDLRRILPWAAGAVLLVLLAAFYLARSRAPDASAAPIATIAVGGEDDGGGGGSRLVIDVAGAVHHPGVYRLAAGSRVEDALHRAGGVTPHADLTQINRAAKLEDGRQVLVPVKVRAGAAPAAASVPGASATPSAPIDLNTATLEQLEELDGVGPATAQKILDYRTAHGGFGSVDELDQVPGIGEKRLAALRDHLRV